MPHQSRAASFKPTTAPVPYDPSRVELITSYEVEGHPARPLTVHIQVSAAQSAAVAQSYSRPGDGPDIVSPYSAEPVRNTELLAGPSMNDGDGGQLIFTYGAGACTRRLVCDLRSGSYQLPPSESARVEALVFSGWAESGNGEIAEPFYSDLTVAGAIVEGWTPAPTRMTYSTRMLLRSTAGGGDPPSFRYPDGARWMQLFAEVPPVGSDMPKIELRNPYALLDYTTGSFVNGSGPIELAPGGFAYSIDYQAGAANQPAMVRFYLEV